MALAESQGFGGSAVVCNSGCMNERVIDKKTGYVCKDDKEFCKRTIIELLNNDKLWKKMNNESLKEELIGMK